jgi:hypothetical protein
MRSKRLIALGQRERLHHQTDWVRGASVAGADVFIWAEGRHAYGWLFERSSDAVRPCGLFWDRCQGDIEIDLIPRITILENSSRINSVAILQEKSCRWSGLEAVPEQWKPRYVSIPEDLRELFFIRRKALASGDLIESDWKKFQKFKVAARLETLELGLLRNQPPHPSNMQCLRYLVGACEMIGRKQLAGANRPN